MFERIFLSWLAAVTAEYLLLPGSCRRLDGLESISRMSGGRAAVVFLLSFLVLSFFSLKFINIRWKKEESPAAHRRRILGSRRVFCPYGRGILSFFAILSAASLRASFTPAFFVACCLLFFRLLFHCGCPAPISHMTKVWQVIHKAVSRKTTDKKAKKSVIGELHRILHNPVKHADGIPRLMLRKRTGVHKVMCGRQTTGKFFLRVMVFLSLLFFLFLSLWTVSRVYCFSTPTYDFGIFSQMFHYMKTTGLPYTTLERDGLLSHFHVHISPIYYLLLPFYCLVPVPATLQVLQAAVVTSSVIPLWKLGRHHGLTPFQRMLLCALLLLYPAFSGGVSYDIHENCFLTPLLLWLFYGIARKNGRITAAAAILTMLVKEDAPVYVACVALWLLFRSLPYDSGRPFLRNNCRAVRPDRWGIIAGSTMLFASLAYFFAAAGYLSVYGDGIMTARYNNFFSVDTASLAALLKTAFLCPMKIVYECADTDKLWFIAITILPLLGLPLFTGRLERYLLLIPYVLINLMPDYAYQHDIFFQYVFGSTACLLYLTVINLADLQQKASYTTTPDTTTATSSLTTAAATASSTTAATVTSSFAAAAPSLSLLTTAVLIAAAAVCAVCFTVTIVPKAVSYPSRCISNQTDYRELRRALSRIPDEASVTASTFYTTFLSQRDVLYDICYASEDHLLSTEYVVLNPGSEHDFKQYARDGKTGYEGLTELLYHNGYHLYTKVNGDVEIYRRSLYHNILHPHAFFH